MTIFEFIVKQFEDFGVRLSDATVLDIVLKNKLTASAEVTASNHREASIAMIKSVPKLLIMPQAVSEGGVSISKASREAILDWYRLQCKEYGIKDELTKKPRVTFL